MGNLGNWLLFAHVVAALWLAAGAFSGAVVRAQIKRAQSLEARVFGLRTAWRLMVVFVLPGAILAGVIGVDLVARRGYSFEDRWVIWSLALYAAMLLNTMAYLAPRLRRTVRAAEASAAAGEPTPELQALAAAKLPGILADVNALGIVVLTLLMTLKP